MKSLYGLVFMVVFSVVMVVGWGLNIWHIVVALKAGTAITAMLIFQMFGVVVFPVGALLGYIL